MHRKIHIVINCTLTTSGNIKQVGVRFLRLCVNAIGAALPPATYAKASTNDHITC